MLWGKFPYSEKRWLLSITWALHSRPISCREDTSGKNTFQDRTSCVAWCVHSTFVHSSVCIEKLSSSRSYTIGQNYCPVDKITCRVEKLHLINRKNNMAQEPIWRQNRNKSVTHICISRSLSQEAEPSALGTHRWRQNKKSKHICWTTLNNSTALVIQTSDPFQTIFFSLRTKLSKTIYRVPLWKPSITTQAANKAEKYTQYIIIIIIIIILIIHNTQWA